MNLIESRPLMKWVKILGVFIGVSLLHYFTVVQLSLRQTSKVMGAWENPLPNGGKIGGSTSDQIFESVIKILLSPGELISKLGMPQSLSGIISIVTYGMLGVLIYLLCTRKFRMPSS
ncbi:MAG: hypothetical protein HYZ85_01985 [Candidatus Omnitrophica bacterium]|nr:hypothetical protein [Candidatus Omnitrophota bacterium]